MTKQELAEQIQVHDHWHNMSDDNRVWTQGRAHYQLIQDELKLLFAKTSDRCVFFEIVEHLCMYLGFLCIISLIIINLFR